MFEKINKLFFTNKITKEERDFYLNSDADITMFEELRRVKGWNELSKRMKEELRNRIGELIKDDQKIQTLILILKQVDVKSARQLLEDEISGLLPE